MARNEADMDADVIGVKWTPSNSTEGADFDECDDNEMCEFVQQHGGL